MKKILFFGDSLTAGYGLRDPRTTSLPALIQQRIDIDKLPYQVINAGQSGDTTSGGLLRIDGYLDQAIDVLVLELGANDILRGIPPQTTSTNLQAIINKVRSRHPNVKMLLLGMELPGWIPGAFAGAFRSVFAQVAMKNDMAFVPFMLEGVAGIRHLNLPDGLHPTADGYKIIADRVWPVLATLLGHQ
ncbi:arylesterase [Mucilaginibacter daejeonensis]|uniref:arylesterase n=1 Tax=Mucilaginibacter daejeonensis TaxID=398049 RepID=UPI00374CF902